MAEGALAGLRVLDLSDHRGIMAGRLLGLMGADVLSIEQPGGSAARRQAPFDAEGQSLHWRAYGTGRRSLLLDRGAEAGRLAALAAQADVVIEAGTPSEGFLDTVALQEANPGLVHLIVTPYGLTGPKADHASSDLTLWAAGGALKPTEAQAGGVPTRITLPQSWHHAAADGLCGVMVALEARRRTGQGQRVVTSAQASITQSTLSLSLAARIGHPDYVFRPEIRSKKKRELDLSGSGSRTQRSKWPVRDGLVEMHLALGPAAGRFTNALFALMHRRGACSEEFAAWDWVTLPPLIENDEIPEEKLEQARAEVAAFLAPMTKAEAVEMALEHRLMLAPIMDTADLDASPHAAARDFFHAVDGLRLPGDLARGFPGGFVVPRAAPAPGEGGAEAEAEWLAGRGAVPFAPDVKDSGAPFAGLTVLDLSWVVAGPMIGRCLSDFGARVIRVESRKKLETARVTGPYPGGEKNPDKSGLYENCNAGKLGVTLDLGTEEGRAVLRDLAAQADVLVESFAPGQMARWGLSHATLAEGNPGLIMLSTSLMGQSGPWHRLAGFGNIGAAMSGLQILAGREGAPPVGPYGPYTDFVAPRVALPVLLAALERRRGTGQGAWLDVSQAEAGMQFIAESFATYGATGAVPVAHANRDPLACPNNVYPCTAAEGETAWVAISAPDDASWKQLAGAVGLPAENWPGLADRQAAEAEIDAALAAWTAGQEAGAVEALLQRLGVPAAVVADTEDLAVDPQLEAWGHFVELPRGDQSLSVVEACRFRLSQTPGAPRISAPHLGRDTEAVLAEVLGYSPRKIDALRTVGALD
ncbi:CaiB/BaiF CoA-transferase family protein [Maritimibacter alkaliphilus]|uniref:CaiB/BaiF CoA-transferase family protein n=1 Tax=Maritimibacter alkaliphilus TaxID=404236 RepID=UPI001C939F42|nr:CoA transferase [Maritimibacter alkaliphilus]MBY6092216.1 CoA transferase [Maritimibacter alkaliphilus]